MYNALQVNIRVSLPVICMKDIKSRIAHGQGLGVEEITAYRSLSILPSFVIGERALSGNEMVVAMHCDLIDTSDTSP